MSRGNGAFVGATGAAIRLVREGVMSDAETSAAAQGPFANKFAPTPCGQKPCTSSADVRSPCGSLDE
ncbi:hypothetical protein B0A91_02570 [Pseudomonas syringae]|nr:hypothetical protein CCL10_21895 [Pseudomonas syringae]PBP65443.1 hypothetical protein CCL15_23580 [Pseudomonas syringae]RXT72456.1 hypothetical protein B1F67_18525 [Pseudomonas syringae]RXU05301.1 hypothetical protein B1F68_16465 [Pseudomonas syringae]RXU11922.1 hypothetical protein B1F70_18260 [Pseudomonas syringae]